MHHDVWIAYADELDEWSSLFARFGWNAGDAQHYAGWLENAAGSTVEIVAV